MIISCFAWWYVVIRCVDTLFKCKHRILVDTFLLYFYLFFFYLHILIFFQESNSLIDLSTDASESTWVVNTNSFSLSAWPLSLTITRKMIFKQKCWWGFLSPHRYFSLSVVLPSILKSEIQKCLDKIFFPSSNHKWKLKFLVWTWNFKISVNSIYTKRWIDKR